jgi:hypothetical protein
MSSGKYALPMPERMPPETLTYRFFAKTYRFTEEMTDNSSVDAVTWWPEIEAAEAYAMEKKNPPPPAQGSSGRRY